MPPHHSSVSRQALGGRSGAALKDEASKFPRAFMRRAAALSVDATPNMGSVASLERTIIALATASSAFSTIHLALALPALWYAGATAIPFELFADCKGPASPLHAPRMAGAPA